jgi:hypothetical protein
MGTGPPAMTEIESKCVGTELNRQSPKAGGLRPLGLANAQPTRLKLVTRVGVEPTDHEGLSFAALPDCVPRRFVKKASPRGFEPLISTLTGWRALRTAPRGRVDE